MSVKVLAPLPNYWWNLLSMFSDMMSWRSPMVPGGLERWSLSSGCSEMASSSSGRSILARGLSSRLAVIERPVPSSRADYVLVAAGTRCSSSSLMVPAARFLTRPSSEWALLMVCVRSVIRTNLNYSNLNPNNIYIARLFIKI